MGLPSIWEDLKQQIYLGDNHFVRRMQQRIPRDAKLDEIPKAQKRGKAKSLSDYAKRYKDAKEAMACAYQSGGYTMKEIADYFKVHYATVSRAVRLFEDTKARFN